MKEFLKKNIAKIAILITILLIVICIIACYNQYTLSKNLRDLEMHLYGYSLEIPIMNALQRYAPLLVISGIFIVTIWIVTFVVNYNEKKMRLVNNYESMISKTANISNADEIKKYKVLLDNGIITQEEFEKKKREFLG